jgi:hypothetical protein
MQQQFNIPSAPVHIKVAYDNEFRRFLLSPITYEHLYSRLKTLFNLQSDFSIKFQDDENDWVLIMTDQELTYATELSGNPLRLQIKLIDSVPSSPATPTETVDRERPWRGRGCGRGRGAGRGGVKISPDERLAKKSSRLSERIDWLETKLKSEGLSSERERVLRWKLTKLQEKLASVKEFQATVQPTEVKTEGPVTETFVPTANDEVKKEDQETSWRGRRGRGCGRGGMRRAMMEGGACGDTPCRKGRKARIDPELIANFRQTKASLLAARDSGNAEEIQACEEAFKAAKAAKWEARAALRAQEDAAGKDEETKA